MSENSAIAWTLVLLGVFLLVAILAEGDAIADNEAQSGVIGKGLHVVSIQIAATEVSALLACEAIACEHIEAPSLVLCAETEPATLGGLAVLEARTVWPAESDLTNGNTDCPALFYREHTTTKLTNKALVSAHSGPGLIGKAFSLHCGWPTLGSPAAQPTGETMDKTGACESVEARTVLSEISEFLPYLATSTPFESRATLGEVGIKADPKVFRCTLRGSSASLSHHSIIAKSAEEYHG